GRNRDAVPLRRGQAGPELAGHGGGGGGHRRARRPADPDLPGRRGRGGVQRRVHHHDNRPPAGLLGHDPLTGGAPGPRAGPAGGAMTTSAMRIGWLAFHTDGLLSLPTPLERGVPIEGVITLTPAEAAKRSGAADYSGLSQE